MLTSTMVSPISVNANWLNTKSISAKRTNNNMIRACFKTTKQALFLFNHFFLFLFFFISSIKAITAITTPTTFIFV